MSKTGVVFLTAAITAIVVSLFWAGVGAVAFFAMRHSDGFPANLPVREEAGEDDGAGWVNSPPPFVVTVRAPTEAVAGESFDVEVNVANPTADELALGSVDIYDALLDGFVVTDIRPEPLDTMDYDGFTAYACDETIAPGESAAVTFTFRAETPGVWTGYIDACTPDKYYLSTSTTIVVHAADAAPEAVETVEETEEALGPEKPGETSQPVDAETAEPAEAENEAR